VHKFWVRASLALLGALTLFSVMAAPPSIGTATARGSIRVDGARITGNATVFEGTLIETDNVTADLRLRKGIEIRLAADSRGKLYGDRLVLEKGSGEVGNARGFWLEANQLKITPFDPNSKGVVSMNGAARIEVAAFRGGFDVRTGSGLLVAKVVPGRMLFFEPQAAGATAPTALTGTLSKENGHYYLTVSETGVKYEITGKDFDKMVGKKVTIKGTIDPGATASGGASAVVTVQSASVAGAAAGAAQAGMALGTKLIIAGVVVGGGTGTVFGIRAAADNGTPASK
jgi:hypothetical protein